MTEEEINNIKVGDKFTVEYTVTNTESLPLGIGVKIRHQGHTWVDKMSKCGNQLKTATLVKTAPKFEKGDTVRVIPDPLTGNAYSDSFVLNRYIGLEGTVIEECDYHGQLEVGMGDAEETGSILINIHCLDLVKKAVKDKFDVRRYLDFGGLDDGWGVCDKETLDTIVYFADNYPNAEAAARDACDRLNKDWRNKQNN